MIVLPTPFIDADYAGIFELLWNWNTSVNSCIMVAPPFLYTSAGIAPFGLFCGQLVKILIVLHLTLSITLTITLTFTLNLTLTLTVTFTLTLTPTLTLNITLTLVRN